jgi:iron complex outermembrane receptor protein
MTHGCVLQLENHYALAIKRADNNAFWGVDMKGAFQTRPFARLLIGTSLLCLAAPAFAADAAADQGADASAGKLDEIVVTAQKREQNLQVVPIAISALSADKVATLGIKDAKDLSGLAPNVTIVQGTINANAAVISIRGINTSAQETFGIDTANALYVDGIYIARSGGSALDVMDIERVEVLRGPQGTLFGRNTTGGAIAFISRAPSETFKLRAEATYGNFNTANARITLDPGSIAGIRARARATHSALRRRPTSAAPARSSTSSTGAGRAARR